ncbi:MAG: cation:proton antiporter [Cyanobacteria bacterium RI_101]|nr:cation:proton antiporter [Cyanobacteria bacterium RI_101]
MGTFILRLGLWLLLTANLGLGNVLFGAALALLLPRPFAGRLTPWQLLQSLGRLLWALPQAYGEALEMLRFPHRYERRTWEESQAQGRPALVFLDIFLITFTPKSLVLQEREGRYEVHYLDRGRRQ